MGIDIRNSGTDSSEDEDTASSSGGPYGWHVTGPGNSSIGSSQGSTSGGATAAPIPGSYQWNQLLQSVQNALNSNGNAPSVGFSCIPKLNDMFAVDFLGFNFGSVNVNGTPNIDILEDAAIAVGTMKRVRHGWETFEMAFLDDQESDVIRILHRQMDEQAAHGDMFDMTIRYYDKQGNETSTLYAVDCEVVNIQTDPLNMATQNPHTQQKLVVEIQPKLVRYA
ncbi:hypothetical protein D3C87_1170880 [compost metagenome]